MNELMVFPPDFGMLPLDVEWKGARQHFGPVEGVTPLIDRLASKTTCATVTLMVGVMCWGVNRLKHHVDQSWNFELAEASFASQVDWRYVDVDKGPGLKEPDQPPALSASLSLNRYLCQAMDGEKPWNSYFQPVMLLSHMVHVVRHILPNGFKQKFHDWLFMAVERLDAIAPKPATEYRGFKEFPDKAAYRAYCAPHRGEPLSLRVLPSIQGELQTFDKQDSLDSVLKMNPARNRYLRTPNEMSELGFSSQPYLARE